MCSYATRSVAASGCGVTSQPNMKVTSPYSPGPDTKGRKGMNPSSRGSGLPTEISPGVGRVGRRRSRQADKAGNTRGMGHTGYTEKAGRALNLNSKVEFGAASISLLFNSCVPGTCA